MLQSFPAACGRLFITACVLAFSLGGPIEARAQSAVAPSAPGGKPSLSTLVGAILTDSTDKPIANAELRFTNLALSARSDSSGQFILSNIPSGSHPLIVRHVGFEPFAATLNFKVGERVEADFVLTPVLTKLADVRITAGADPRYAMQLTDFEQRRKFGTGRFLTSDVFESAVGLDMSQVLVSRIPSLRTSGKGGEQALVSRRMGRDCYMQVFVNGLLIKPIPPQRGFDINSILTMNVLGLEFYTVANTPTQYAGSTSGECGTVLIWIK